MANIRQVKSSYSHFTSFIKNHLKSGQKRPDFEWSGFQLVGTIALAIAKARPCENQTI